MQTTLVLMAAGKGTRYGGPKQLEGFGPHGELLMDYSIADAVHAGFEKVVLVVREEHLQQFQEKMEGHALRQHFEVAYAIQEEALGTGDAARSAAPYVQGPCVVMNSDDYYGDVSLFLRAQEFLLTMRPEDAPPRYGMFGYPLSDTLSGFGRVARAICEVDAASKLQHISEWFDLHLGPDGVIYGMHGHDEQLQIDDRALCSMSFWLLPPQFMVEVERDFRGFLARPRLEGRAGEFHLTAVIEEHRASKRAEVTVLPLLHSSWCGVTNPGDRDGVVAKLAALHADGTYGILRS